MVEARREKIPNHRKQLENDVGGGEGVHDLREAEFAADGPIGVADPLVLFGTLDSFHLTTPSASQAGSLRCFCPLGNHCVVSGSSHGSSQSWFMASTS